jgi:hypothetical protein
MLETSHDVRCDVCRRANSAGNAPAMGEINSQGIWTFIRTGQRNTRVRQRRAHFASALGEPGIGDAAVASMIAGQTMPPVLLEHAREVARAAAGLGSPPASRIQRFGPFPSGMVEFKCPACPNHPRVRYRTVLRIAQGQRPGSAIYL